MKVLKKGLAESTTWVGKCNVCGAVFEAEKTELPADKKQTKGNKGGNKFNESYVLDCTECSETNCVSFYMSGTRRAKMQSM